MTEQLTIVGDSLSHEFRFEFNIDYTRLSHRSYLSEFIFVC